MIESGIKFRHSSRSCIVYFVSVNTILFFDNSVVDDESGFQRDTLLFPNFLFQLQIRVVVLRDAIFKSYCLIIFFCAHVYTLPTS